MALLALDRSPSGSTRFARGGRAALIGPGRVRAYYELFFVKTLEPVGIGSEEAAGSPKVLHVVRPTGTDSEEAAGAPGLVLVVKPQAGDTEEAAGVPAVYQPSLQVVDPLGADTLEAAGAPAVVLERWRNGLLLPGRPRPQTQPVQRGLARDRGSR